MDCDIRTASRYHKLFLGLVLEALTIFVRLSLQVNTRGTSHITGNGKANNVINCAWRWLISMYSVAYGVPDVCVHST